MSETFPIQIESVELSKDFLNDLLTRFENIHKSMQDNYSRIYFILEYKNGQEYTTYNKEEFFQELNFRNLKKLYFHINGDSKTLSMYINIDNDLDSNFKITSEDKVWNRGTASLFKELIEYHEKKINKWLNKYVGKV